MQLKSRNDLRVYKASIHLLVVLGIFTLFFAILGILIVVRRQDWTFLSSSATVAAAILALQQVLRFEIGPTSFKYRNLSGSREVAFADVGRAYFDVIYATYAPQGIARFWVELRDGTQVKINLRTFPVEAAAVLFAALESHSIQITMPDAWIARRTAEQVRAAQAKLQKNATHIRPHSKEV